MPSLNKVLLAGHLGKDVEMSLAKQLPIAKFSLATTKKKRGHDPVTQWHRVVVFGKQAENCQKFLTKGAPVLVEGEISYGSYENKQGHKVYTTDIVANNIQFLGSKQSQSNDKVPDKYLDENGNVLPDDKIGFKVQEPDLDQIPF